MIWNILRSLFHAMPGRDKERKREYMKEYQSTDEYKARKKEYDRAYREKNLERINQRKREKHLENKERDNEISRHYYEVNKVKINNACREQYKSDDSKYEKIMLNSWTRSGIIILENTFKNYLEATNCEHCGNQFGERGGKLTKNKKSLDHDHHSGYPRFVICHSCNIALKKVDKLRDYLHLELHRYFNRIK